MAMLPNPLPRLADDPSGAALGLRLPPGRLVDTTLHGRWHEPLLWQADGPTDPESWRGLLAARSLGLLPVLLGSGSIPGRDDVTGWGLDPDLTSYPGDHDAEEVLAELWARNLAELSTDDGTPSEDADDAEPDADSDEDDGRGELLAPYGREWLGLAERPSADPALPEGQDPDLLAADYTADVIRAGRPDRPRAALAYARRSADIPAAIGWTGPANHEDDIAALCAVLRSWEDRFGLRVVALGYDTLTATVAAPPTTIEEAEDVAAEHFAFCPDAITQGVHDSLRTYADRALLVQETWHFRWH
jgi:hypothetical protein